MRVGYSRVSTVDQNVDLQHDALIQAGCEKIFTDKASGARADRPELAKALDYTRDGDTLICWRLDRLARSLAHLIEIIESLEQKGAGFRSLTESIDTTTSGGRLIFHIFGALSEFERSLIQERTRAGLIAARKRGRVGGRPRAMTDSKIEAAEKLLGAGMAASQVASTIGVSIPTLYRYLPANR